MNRPGVQGRDRCHSGHRRGKSPRPADRADETLRSQDPAPRHSGESYNRIRKPLASRAIGCAKRFWTRCSGYRRGNPS